MSERTHEQQMLADLLLSLGIRLPIRVGGNVGRGLSDADGMPLFMGAPTGSLSTDRARALAFAFAINNASGTPNHDVGPLPVLRPLTAGTIRAAENPFDPNHLVALAQAARRPAAE